MRLTAQSQYIKWFKWLNDVERMRKYANCNKIVIFAVTFKHIRMVTFHGNPALEGNIHLLSAL